MVPILNNRLQNILSDVAMFADKETVDVEDELSRGYTLVQSSGLTASDLLDRLSNSLNEDIDNKLGGTLSNDELTKLKSAGRSQLMTVINTSGYRYVKGDTAFNADAIIQKAIGRLASDAAFFGNKDVSDVLSDLSQGRNLVQASGLTASELLGDILNNVNQELTVAAANANASQDALSKAKSDAAAKISAVLQGGSLAPSGSAATDLNKIVAGRLARIIDDAASLAGADVSDVIGRLDTGANLITATGLSAADLKEGLIRIVNQDIDLVAASGGIDTTAAEAAKLDARMQISELVTKSGLSRQTNNDIDAQAIIDRRLAMLAEDVAFISGVEKSTVLDAVEKGKTLQQASGMTGPDLLDRLSELAAQDIDTAASGKNVSADKLAEWKAVARQQIAAKLFR
ncbi:hypothetical protein LJK88_31360 [Paenibacillus sp. P26]|nr:hypothetical protein LJK88_31360 [Paenibacillus sp. P26]